MNLQHAINGGIAGLMAAVLVDLHGFSTTTDPNKQFDFKLALTRYAMGFVAGFIGGLGLSAMQPIQTQIVDVVNAPGVH